MKLKIKVQPVQFIMTIILTVIALLALISLSGCGVSSKVSKEIHRSETNTSFDATQKTTKQRHTNIDKVERIDTLVTIPGEKLSVWTDLQRIIRGDTVKYSNGGLSVSLYADQSGNLGADITSEEKQVEVKMEKTTKTSESEDVKSDQKVSGTTSQSTEDRSIQRKWRINGTTMTIIILIVALAVLIYFRRSIPFINKFLPNGK